MNTSILCSNNATARLMGSAAGVAGAVVASYPSRKLASEIFPKRPR